MVPFWGVIIAAYVFWNQLNYLGKYMLIAISKYFGIAIDIGYAEDIIYWIGERILFLLFMIYLYQQVKNSIWLRFAWIPKTFIWVAAGKLIYVILILAAVIKPNEFWMWMGTMFAVAIGYLLRRLKIQHKFIKLGVPKWNT